LQDFVDNIPVSASDKNKVDRSGSQKLHLFLNVTI